MSLDKPKKPEIDHRTIKLLIGVIAIALPILTSIFSLSPLESISASYYEIGPSQSIFIGFLFAIAAFLTAYNGRESPEMVLSRVAAVAGLFIVLFPCGRDDSPVAYPAVHFVAAAVMFLILAGFCYIFYRRAKAKKFREAKRRAVIYLLCGIAIAASILTLAVDLLLKKPGAAAGPLSAYIPRLVYWGETVGLVAFGISWLMASRIVPGFAQQQERAEYLQGPLPHL